MAAVSAAMFRPGGHFDPASYATQKIYENHDPPKSKKWSSKLKLNTSGSVKSPDRSPESPYLYGTVSAPGGSALCKSMKYAETWLYGSVNPPSRSNVFSNYPEVQGPVLISTPQKPTPHNYAVILCSCPEYLNGTKKASLTKVSICKKCKGSRLPLTITDSSRLLVGGTVRGHQINRETGLLRAGTVRVPGTKSRPTILKSNEDTDPYDLMRRNRLATPHEARIGSQFSVTRTRAKSISPCRVKIKAKPSPETLQKNRSKSVTRVNELWIDENDKIETKKSILSCDINPYDLIDSSRASKSMAEIEFDDDFGDVFQRSLNSENIKSLNKSRSEPVIKAINGQRIKITDESNENSTKDTTVLTYDSVNYDPNALQIKAQDFSPALSLPEIKSDVKKSNTNNKKNTLSTIRIKQKSISPKRPPRKIRHNMKNDDDSESDNQKFPDKYSSKKFKNELSRRDKGDKNKIKNSDPIKSILKKPKNYDVLEFDNKSNDNSENRIINELNYEHVAKYQQTNKIMKNNSCSQSFLQRKRVQFLVENDETKVIYTAEFNLENNIVRGIHENNAIDIEEDVQQEGDVVSNGLVDDFDVLELINQKTVHHATINYEDIYTGIDKKNTFEAAAKEKTVGNYNAENITTQLDNAVPKVPVLRRSESERLPSTVLISEPKFLDTMALRPKSKHGHTSQVFFAECPVGQDTQNKEILESTQATKSDITSKINETEIESGNLSDSSEITREVLNNLRQCISPEPPPRLRSKERTKFKKNNYVKTRYVANNSSSSTSDEWSDSNDHERKTILRVKQFDSDDTEGSKSITHAVKSKENEPRKTSIEINGNECYSTINVSNDTPIYLSSVVVNDDSKNSDDEYQSGTLVTISVGTTEDEANKSKSKVYIGGTLSKNSSDTNAYEEYSANNKDNLNAIVSYGCKNDLLDVKKILGDPVEAVKLNLIPHVCGKFDNTGGDQYDQIPKSENLVTKVFDDPLFSHLAEGLDLNVVKRLIENSLIKLQESKSEDNCKESVEELIENSLITLKADSNKDNKQEENLNISDSTEKELLKNETLNLSVTTENFGDSFSAPYESMEYESGVMGVFSDHEPMSDCYNASASELSTEDDTTSSRSKFYQMLVDTALCEIEIANNTDDEHHYESIRLNCDPIYEEIGDVPPPLPLNPPPSSLSLLDDEKRSGSRSIFEGASKYDILSYLVDAKERGIDNEETYITNYGNENVSTNLSDSKDNITPELINSRLKSKKSHLSNASDSSEDNSLIIHSNMDQNIEKSTVCKKSSTEIERNDSGVGSETSKSSRSKLQGKSSPYDAITNKDSPIHLCEDCDTTVDIQTTEQGSTYAPLVCRKCAKKRAERKEIITEIVETEEKYGRDLQIILEEFYKPMLVAGLLTQEQLSAIFLNVEELIENNQVLSEKLRDGLEIALDQGDEDLLTVNVGKILLECSGMLTAFQSYCVKQAGAALILAGLEKEKELLRIFLRVSQMENTVLRRMNLNSFLMVPVQRVTKYPLLLSRLYRATAACATEREDVRAAQRCVESRLEEMNSAAAAAAAAARDVPLWRRLAAARRTAHDLHVADIRLRKMAVDVLDWNHDDARFAMEGKLLFTQPNDNNWRKGRTIKLSTINALLVTNGKPTTTHKVNEIRETREARDREAKEREGEALFARSGVREAALLLVREKAGRYTLQRDPLFLDRCVVAADHEPEHFFEVHEITTKDSYIFKAEENSRTRLWYRQLQYHAQGMGAWRKRRSALANIMINPMLTRN